MTSYELWDIRSASIIQSYDNECDALALVLSGSERNGPDDTDTLILNVEDDEGNVTFIAQGQELAERARRELAIHRQVG